MLRIGFKPEDQNKNRSQNFEINTEIRINMLNSWKPYHKNQTKLLFQILKTQKSFFFKLIRETELGFIRFQRNPKHKNKEDYSFNIFLVCRINSSTMMTKNRNSSKIPNRSNGYKQIHTNNRIKQTPYHISMKLTKYPTFFLHKNQVRIKRWIEELKSNYLL